MITTPRDLAAQVAKELSGEYKVSDALRIQAYIACAMYIGDGIKDIAETLKHWELSR